jgi:hypothetical protein
MTICSLLSSEQTTAIKDQFARVEITDADFDRIEVGAALGSAPCA